MQRQRWDIYSDLIVIWRLLKTLNWSLRSSSLRKFIIKDYMTMRICMLVIDLVIPHSKHQ